MSSSRTQHGSNPQPLDPESEVEATCKKLFSNMHNKQYTAIFTAVKIFTFFFSISAQNID